MPHVVLNGKTAVEDIFRELKPLFIKNENSILRTTDAYLERKKNDILIDSLAIGGGKRVVFLMMISGREDGVVVRLYSNVAVEKTAEVKKLLAEQAKQLLHDFPELTVGETNLSEYLK